MGFNPSICLVPLVLWISSCGTGTPESASTTAPSTTVKKTTTTVARVEKVVNGHVIKPGVNLSGVNLSDANLASVDLSNANLSKANLTNANLFGANLSGADLTGANLEDAFLAIADLTNANLRNANLRNVGLSSANLTGANLTNADLRGTSFFKTIMPDGSERSDDEPSDVKVSTTTTIAVNSKSTFKPPAIALEEAAFQCNYKLIDVLNKYNITKIEPQNIGRIWFENSDYKFAVGVAPVEISKPIIDTCAQAAKVQIDEISNLAMTSCMFSKRQLAIAYEVPTNSSKKQIAKAVSNDFNESIRALVSSICIKHIK
jgi:uncharacterized protein YjbI with pentapeptide repeats